MPQKALSLLRKLSFRWDSLWDASFLFSHILIPLITLIAFCLSFAYFVSKIWSLPDSVNYVFANRSWKLFSMLVVIPVFVLIYLKVIRGRTFEISNQFDKLSQWDALLLLVPLTPVVQYMINNRDILSPTDFLIVLVYLVVFSSTYIFAFPLLLQRVSPPRILMLLGMSFVTTITSMALISKHFAWFASGNLPIQLSFLLGIFLSFSFLLQEKNRQAIHVVIVIIFALNTSVQWQVTNKATEEANVQQLTDNHPQLVFEGKSSFNTPNIYLLIYDAYVANETMLAYGIDNSAQEDYLVQKGFELYPHTYSVASNSTATVGRMLNISSELIINARIPASGNGIVQNAFKDIGYETYGVFPSDFFFLGVGSAYDYYFPEESTPSEILLSGIFMGEFRFDIIFKDSEREQFIATKRNVFETDSTNPIFMYTHSDLPKHSQNSGACLPDEKELFGERLSRANVEMQLDVETIIDNDPGALMIVAGDHGPYLTKNCTATNLANYDISEISRLDIQDRFGTFLAIRWPSDDYYRFDDITVLQDVFPAVFAYIFNDQSFLEAKISSDTVFPYVVSGASVQDGIIIDGIHDGEPLFLGSP